TGQYLFSLMAHRRAMIVGSLGLVFSQIGLAAAMSLDWVVLFAVSIPLSGLFYGAALVGSVRFANHTVAPHQRTARMSNLYLIGYFLSSAPAVILGFLADRVDPQCVSALLIRGHPACAGSRDAVEKCRWHGDGTAGRLNGRP
ncbi:MAG: hypothetical protein ACRECY_16595, partial [Phyllobacterium sp.]